jgi:hypothetical protein
VCSTALPSVVFVFKLALPLWRLRPLRSRLDSNGSGEDDDSCADEANEARQVMRSLQVWLCKASTTPLVQEVSGLWLA